MKRRLRAGLRRGGAALLLGATFALGYWAGLNDKGPQQRALVTVRRTPGNPNPTGWSYQWYDINKPWEAARLRSDEKRLADQGTEHYVTEGVIEWSLHPRPDPRRVNAHR